MSQDAIPAGHSDMPIGLLVENVSKTYGRSKVRALSNLYLRIEPGEIFGVIGPNGAGKTTLFGCLLGLLRPSEGRIQINGGEPDSLAVRGITGYLPERPHFDRWMTGRRFLSYHHGLSGRPKEARVREIMAALELVGLESRTLDLFLKKYSRGMLQRLGLAQALLGKPRYLFLDEPCSGLDPAGVLLVRRLIQEQKGLGVTVVLNSHQLDEVEKTCDRVAFIRGGRLESIESLAVTQDSARVIIVRWIVSSEVPVEQLAQLGSRFAARLVRTERGRAFFAVPDDRRCAELVAGLVSVGFPVIEVSRMEGRLERLFDAGDIPNREQS